MFFIKAILILCLFTTQGFALGSEVMKGGSIRLSLQTSPHSFNPYLNEDSESEPLLQYLFSPLMRYEEEKNTYSPLIAEKVMIQKNGTHYIYSYQLNQKAEWEDHTPITSEDVEYTFQTLTNDKGISGSKQVYFKNIQFKKITERRFQFECENPNVNTLGNLNHFQVLQKKEWIKRGDWKKVNLSLFPTTSGPYRIKKFDPNLNLTLERKKDWWAKSLPSLKNDYNFDEMTFQIIPDATLGYEKFIKNELDLIKISPETFHLKVLGNDRELFSQEISTQKKWASHFKTKAPSEYSYLGWNLKNNLFQNLKTRIALAHLVPYEKIIKQVYFDEAIRSISPFGSNSPNTAKAQTNLKFDYNSKLALKMLKELGWTQNEDGILVQNKNNKITPFAFTLLYNQENLFRAKIAQILQEEFKKLGITLNIQSLEFHAMLEKVKKHNFDAILLSWVGGNINANTAQAWASESYSEQGSNFIGFSNPEADAIIKKTEQELDPNARFKLVQKLGKLIYLDQPYAFLAEQQGFIIAVQPKIKAEKWSLNYSQNPPIYKYFFNENH